MKRAGRNGTKPLAWARGAEPIASPPMPVDARREAGFWLRMAQEGHSLSMPRSRPMPSIGSGCHELRLTAERAEWRVFYYVDAEIVLVLGVFQKTTRRTPVQWLETCRERRRLYRRVTKEKADG